MKSKVAGFVVLAISVMFVAAVPASASKNLYFATGDNATNAEMQVFSLAADGTPAPLQTVTGTAGGYFNAVTMSPDGKFVFVVDYNKNELRSYVVGADGKLTDAPGSPKALPGNPGPYGSAVSPDGKFLLVGMYDAHGVQAFTIGANGSLTAAPGGLVELDPTVLPFSVAVSTDSRTVYVPDFLTDKLYSLHIAADGLLTELAGSPVPTGTESYQAAVTPDGKYLYAPNSNSDNVSGYSLGADGTPTALPGSPFPVTTDAYGGLSISPDGRTLYSSGSSDEIQSVSIASNGSLAAGPSVAISAYNPALALNPAGTRLYNGVDANDPTNRLQTYSVGAGGALTPFGVPLALANTISPDTDSLVVTPAQPPVAKLAAKSGLGGTVSFDASASTDPDGPIATYAWDFGDGQTASTTTPTTNHNYATDGNYTATVTLTDEDGCSTVLVTTGRFAYCNGSGVAKATTTAVADKSVSGAKVTAKKTQKQKRGKKLLISVKAGAKEAVKLAATGSGRFKGLKGKVVLKTVKTQASAGQFKTLKLRAKSGKKGRAAARRKGKVTVSVKLTDSLGNSTTKKVTVKTVPSKRARG